MAGDTPQRVRYRDRLHAGYELAADLRLFLGGQDPLVLAIPRGGVPVAAALAEDLRAPLDLVLARRIESPAPGSVTMGAITPDRTLVVNKALISQLDLTDKALEELSTPVWAEAQRLQQLYRRGRPYPDLRGRTAVIVDDRLTTGYSIMAAVVSARKLEPTRVVVAVPVASVEGIERVRSSVDELLSLEITNDPAFLPSRYYANSAPVTDQEVIWTLDRSWAERPPDGYTETF